MQENSKENQHDPTKRCPGLSTVLWKTFFLPKRLREYTIIIPLSNKAKCVSEGFSYFHMETRGAKPNAEIAKSTKKVKKF